MLSQKSGSSNPALGRKSTGCRKLNSGTTYRECDLPDRIREMLNEEGGNGRGGWNLYRYSFTSQIPLNSRLIPKYTNKNVIFTFIGEKGQFGPVDAAKYQYLQ
jgi:hypothetical protein